MATYATDLTVLDACDSATGWSELPSPHAAGAAPAADTENYFHNAISVSQASGQATGTGAGIQFDNGSALTWTATSNWVVMVWVFYAAPTNLGTWSSGGVRLGIGSADNNAEMYNALGTDFGTGAYGGWQNTAIDPEFATSDATIGTVGSGYQNFAILPNITAKITKGSPMAVDVLRYGRGELQVSGTGSTFDGMATANDNATTGRWGLFQLFGKAYDWKGLMSLGLTGTSVTFTATSVTINIQDTPRVLAGFNKIEINHASSSVTWTTVSINGSDLSITGSAPVSPGDFEVVDNATVSKTSCTFTDMGTFIYLSNSTLTTCIYRRCELVTQGGATFTGCTFEDADNTIAVDVDDLDIITDCIFNSDGTGHAVDLGTIAATGSVDWDNFDDGYAATNGSTGNETILVSVNSGQTLTINVLASAGSTPTYKNDGTGTVVVSVAPVTISVDVTNSTGTPIEDARVEISATETIGTITDGDILLTGLTDVNGNIKDTGFVYEGAFDPSGLDINIKVRQGSVQPYKVPSNTTGTIVSGTGFSTIVALQPDE